MKETGLTHFNRARQELQKAKTFDEVKAIRDTAERLRLYLRLIDESLEMQNDAAEIKLRAERRLGEMLREAAEKGDRKGQGKPQQRSKKVTSSKNDDVTFSPVTLAEIGISKMQSSRWQSIATIPEEEFEQTIQEMKQAHRELTQSVMLRVAQKIKREQSGEHRPRDSVDQKRSHVHQNQGFLFDQKQESLFDLDDYRKAIDYHVSAANHHFRVAQHLRKQAFKRYRVQMPLPFEFADQVK